MNSKGCVQLCGFTSMQSRSIEHSLSLAISFFSIVISIICVQRYKQLLRKTHSVAHFRPKTKKNIHYWGKMELNEMLLIIQISKMLHFTSLHLQSRLIKQQNLGATLELLKLSKTPMVLNQWKTAASPSNLPVVSSTSPVSTTTRQSASMLLTERLSALQNQ